MIGQHYYTWCPRDKGCEGITGFQTRAKSPSITDQIEQVVKRYCSRYKLPHSLSYLETNSVLTSDELQKSPVAIHYYPISKDLLGLTRVCLSPKQKGRAGNIFFAHTLVLSQEVLSQIAFNPFILIRSGIFKNSDDDASTVLDDLNDFSNSINMEEYDNRWLDRCRVIDNDLLSALLTCLSTSEQQIRPIILNLPRVQDSIGLIEGVFLLLPRPYRFTISFSTYEPDPYRLLTTTEKIKNIIIGTIPAEEGGEFQFREDEYKTGCYIFNLYQKRQSEIPSSLRYVKYICNAVNRADTQSIEQLNNVIERLGIGFNPNIWNEVIPLTYLLSEGLDKMSTDKWDLAINALQSTCTTPEQAKEGLELLWGKSHNCLHILSSDMAKRLLSAYRELLNNTEDPNIFCSQTVTEMINSFYSLLLSRRYSLASDLITLSGQPGDIIRSKVILQGITRAHQKKSWPETQISKDDESEIKAFIDILAEGFNEISKDRSSLQFLPNMIISGMSAAHSWGYFEKAWDCIEKWLLTDGLKSIAEKQRNQVDTVLEKIGALLSKEGKYARYSHLLLWQLEYAMPPQERRIEFFSKIKMACKKSPDPVAVANKVMRKAKSILDKEDLIVLYIDLFDKGKDKISEEVAKHYQQSLQDMKGEETQWDFRRHIASIEGDCLLAWEYSETLFPWSDKSVRNICLWIDKVFRVSPETAFTSISEFCSTVQQQEDPRIRILSLKTCLQELRKVNLGKISPRLISRVVETLILLSPRSVFDNPQLEEIIKGVDTESLSKAAKAFIQVAKIIQTAKTLPNTNKPDLVLFLKENPELPQILTLVEHSAWVQVCEWILSGLYGLYIEDTETVCSAVKLILSPTVKAERSSQAVDFFVRKLRSELLEGTFQKDYVTHVRTLSQFIFAVSTLSLDQLIAQIIAPILAEDSRLTERLLWPYLETHPALKEETWNRWLNQFKGDVIALMRQQREVSFFSRLIKFCKRLFIRKIETENISQSQPLRKNKVKKRNKIKKRDKT